MKKLLFFLLAAGICAARQLTLDTQLIDASGRQSSLYDNPGLAMNAGALKTACQYEVSITIYVKVDELYGAEALKKGVKYRVDEVSWQGHPRGWYVGGHRYVRIANGREYTDMRTIEIQKDGKPGVVRKASDPPLYFSKDSLLEINLRMQKASNPACLFMRYYNAPDRARITGAAMNLTPDGKLAGGTPEHHIYNKKWRFNSPAVRIKATPVSR